MYIAGLQRHGICSSSRATTERERVPRSKDINHILPVCVYVGRTQPSGLDALAPCLALDDRVVWSDLVSGTCYVSIEPRASTPCPRDKSRISSSAPGKLAR